MGGLGWAIFGAFLGKILQGITSAIENVCGRFGRGCGHHIQKHWIMKVNKGPLVK